MADPKLLATFRKPFTEQVAAFRLRLGNLVPTRAWDDLRHSAHERAFVVAGALKADLLADLAAAIDKAIAEGTGLEEFRRDFRAIVEKHGWHGWTGEGSARGEAWRTRVIWQTNMLTSLAAGRWAQLQEGGFSYFVYRHSGAAHPRLDHLSWDGLILPSDHPFWQTHYPPNGWGCGCRVLGAHSRAGAERVGGKPGKKLPELWNLREAKTGTPPGIGKGWDYPPGASVANTIQAMTQKTVAWPYEIAKAFMQSLPAGTVDRFVTGYRALPSLATDLRRYAERALGRRGGREISDVVVEKYRTLGRLTSAQERHIADLGLDVAGYDFAIDAPAVKHVFRKHGSEEGEARRGHRAVTPADFGLLPSLIDKVAEISSSGTSYRTGQPLVKFVISRGTEEWVVVFEQRRRRKMLALTTFYIRRKR